MWDSWRRHLKALGWDVNVLDLRGHGRSLPIDYSSVTMDEYVADLASVTRQIAVASGQHPIVAGWGMGGLVSLMYAAAHPGSPALLLFAPYPPKEAAGRADPDEVRKTPSGAYGPELHGIFPGEDIAKSRRALFDLNDEEALAVLKNSAGAEESGFARRQRQRGISVPAESIACPVLVIYGEMDSVIPAQHSRATADYLNADLMTLPEAGHWGILYHEQWVAEHAPALDAWVRQHIT